MRRFRLYPQPRTSRLYVEVRVYRSRRLMVAALERYDRFLNVSADWSHTLAVCRGTWIVKRHGKVWRRISEVARVYLPSHHLGSGLVAHELTHAACMWARRVRLNSQAVVGSERGRRRSRGRPLPSLMENPANEQFADVMGQLNAQFWRHWYSCRRTAR